MVNGLLLLRHSCDTGAKADASSSRSSGSRHTHSMYRLCPFELRNACWLTQQVLLSLSSKLPGRVKCQFLEEA